MLRVYDGWAWLGSTVPLSGADGFLVTHCYVLNRGCGPGDVAYGRQLKYNALLPSPTPAKSVLFFVPWSHRARPSPGHSVGSLSRMPTFIEEGLIDMQLSPTIDRMSGSVLLKRPVLKQTGFEMKFTTIACRTKYTHGCKCKNKVVLRSL